MAYSRHDHVIRTSRANQCREVVSSNRVYRTFLRTILALPPFFFLFQRRCSCYSERAIREKETDDPRSLTLADVTEHCARGSGFPCVRAGCVFSREAKTHRCRAVLRRARGGYALNSSRSRQRSRRFSDDATLAAYVRITSTDAIPDRTIFLLTNNSRGQLRAPRHLQSDTRSSLLQKGEGRGRSRKKKREGKRMCARGKKFAHRTFARI